MWPRAPGGGGERGGRQSRCTRAPGARSGSAPHLWPLSTVAHTPDPRPPLRQPGPDRPQGDENFPRTRYLGLGDLKKPRWPPPFRDLEPQPWGGGPHSRPRRLPGNPDNALLTLPGTRVWGTQISCTCSLLSDTPTRTHITPFPAPNSSVLLLCFISQNHITPFEASPNYLVLGNPNNFYL